MTSPQNLTTTSKFLSLVLRHKPQTIGLTLDAAGWVEVDVLLAKAAAANRPLTRQLLEEVVETSDKKRFAFSEDGLRIRANQAIRWRSIWACRPSHRRRCCTTAPLRASWTPSSPKA